MIIPVILSGGAGTRLWPLSRQAYPKQLLALTSEKTLIQQTADRARSIKGASPPFGRLQRGAPFSHCRTASADKFGTYGH